MNPQSNTLETSKIVICFHLNDEIRKSLVRDLESLDTDILTPVSTENLHMTALFLGHVVTSIMPTIKEILQNVAASERAFMLKNGRTIIMHPDEPYMLWSRYDRERWHEEVILSLEKIFWKIGTWKGSRDRKQRKQSGDRYSQAHITLAYARDGRLLDSLHPGIVLSKQSSSINIKALDLVLITGGGESLKYTVLESYALSQ